jgi:hypothetical protein
VFYFVGSIAERLQLDAQSANRHFPRVSPGCANAVASHRRDVAPERIEGRSGSFPKQDATFGMPALRVEVSKTLSSQSFLIDLQF